MASLSQYNHMSNMQILAEYKDLLSVNDLSKIFEVSSQTIYKELKDGKFGTPIKIGRVYKIPRIRIINEFFSS